MTMISSGGSSESNNNSNKGSSKWKISDTAQDTGFLPTVAVTLWMGWNGFLLWLILYTAFLAGKWQRMVIVGLATLSLVLPVDFPGSLGHRVGDWIMLQAEKYFALRMVIEDEGDLIRHSKQNKAIIFAFNPHDILPYPVFAFNPILRRLPGVCEEGVALMTSSVFKIPFLRHVYSWVKGKSVDKRTFLGRLHEGASFVFSPGGVQEVLLQDPNKPSDVVLYLKNRKGFIKLALETGSPIVPVFCFNLDGSFRYWVPRGRMIEKLSRSLGFAPLVYWGRWCIPFGIPVPRKIHVVIGPAIDVPNEGDKVSQESIEKFHGIFIKELDELFNRHKHGVGYGDRQLKII